MGSWGLPGVTGACSRRVVSNMQKVRKEAFTIAVRMACTRSGSQYTYKIPTVYSNKKVFIIECTV